MSNVLYWTYLGGDGDDRAYAATEDAEGNIWVCGFTTSLKGPLDVMVEGFPATTCYRETGWSNCTPPAGWTWAANKSQDAFMVKLPFNLSATPLIVSTVVGGSGNESPRGTIAVHGNPPVAYISGGTASANFPVSTSALAAQPGTGSTATVCNQIDDKRDAFVVKVNQGGIVLWSRCLGGADDDNAWGNVRIDSANGDIFIGGCTRSTALHNTSFDTGIQIHDSLNGPADPYIAKLASSTGKILALRFHGGSGLDWVAFNDCLELDSSNQPVIIGITRSMDFPLTSYALSRVHSNDPGNPPLCPLVSTGCPTAPPSVDCDPHWNDVFVAKFTNDLGTVLNSTYLNRVPGSSPSACYREEPAGLGLYRNAVFISGETDSAGFPIAGATFDPSISCGVTVPCGSFHDAFFVKIFLGTASASVLHYSTFFGGDVSAAGATENGNRARCISVWPAGHGALTGVPVFAGVTTMPDFAAMTTPSVVFEDWLTTCSQPDTRQAFFAIPNID